MADHQVRGSWRQRHAEANAALSFALVSSADGLAEDDCPKMMGGQGAERTVSLQDLHAEMPRMDADSPSSRGRGGPGKAHARALWAHLKHAPWLKSVPDQR